MDTDMDSDTTNRPQLIADVEEGKVFDHDQDPTVANLDQALLAIQTYHERMRGIRFFMGWTHNPEIDTTAPTADDNLFAGPKLKPAAKVSLHMPTDDWLIYVTQNPQIERFYGLQGGGTPPKNL